ncbi:D-glycero-beta-D-manno-heptose 1,7-bisphosphate 7-phosphatase [Brackiella oedipodis]|uniref:D-glycero-beta-D-manno-heptose 1,7-bisphosphate 7-phosphatase n=1 Tax=Brackiella oedipodis TaxID=124225 RepID=UPI00048EECC7|nr:D-glycero-beta-D-manno-heptose 1,7-bisphosphate 7-phosphatase [Brackiella oedipodis]
MKLVVLDRDGVINKDSPDYIKSADEWHALAGSLEAIARLNAAGYKVAVATNQSGIGRGLFSFNDLLAMHTKMQQALSSLGGSIDAFFICPHHPDESCDCRKPAPGLFKEIRQRYHLSDEQEVVAVGDSLRDLQAAQATGFRPVLVKTGNGINTLTKLSADSQIPVYNDLADFVSHFLQPKT